MVSETEVDPERPYLQTVESAALALVARSELALGHPPEAVTPAGRALEIRRHTQWEGSPLLLEARLVFAEALAGTGDAARLERSSPRHVQEPRCSPEPPVHSGPRSSESLP